MREPLPRERAEVQTIRPGDFTHITGFRRVAGVLVRPRRKEVKITWADGSDAVFPLTHTDPKHPEYDRPYRLRVLRREHAPGYVASDETASVRAPNEDALYVYDPEQSQVRAA